jgi:outer membrane protein
MHHVLRLGMRAPFGILLVMWLVSDPKPAFPQTLPEALGAAYQNNPTLLAERAQLRAVDERVAQALSGWRPTIEIAADGRAERLAASEAPGGRPNPYAIGDHSYFANDYGIAIKQPIYRGGRTVAATAQATAEVEAERAHLDSVEQLALLNAATDYFDVVLGQGLVALAVEHERTTATESERVAQLYKAGAVTGTDLAEASTAAVHAKEIRRQAVLTLDVSRSSFLRDTGVAAQALKMPSVSLALPESRSQALELAAAANPDLLTVENLAKAGVQAIEVARGRLLPSINLFGSIGHRDNYPFEFRREDVGAIGIEISIPLYDGGTSHSQVREATQLRSALEHKSDTERATAAAAAASSWDRLQAATDEVELARRTSEGSAEIVIGMQKEFAIGKRSVRELFDAMDALLKARIAYLQAQHDEGVARFTLAFAVGRLTARQLALPVQYYDPTAHFRAVRDRWFGTGDQP